MVQSQFNQTKHYRGLVWVGLSIYVNVFGSSHTMEGFIVFPLLLVCLGLWVKPLWIWVHSNSKSSSFFGSCVLISFKIYPPLHSCWTLRCDNTNQANLCLTFAFKHAVCTLSCHVCWPWPFSRYSFKMH